MLARTALVRARHGAVSIGSHVVPSKLAVPPPAAIVLVTVQHVESELPPPLSPQGMRGERHSSPSFTQRGAPFPTAASLQQNSPGVSHVSSPQRTCRGSGTARSGKLSVQEPKLSAPTTPA